MSNKNMLNKNHISPQKVISPFHKEIKINEGDSPGKKYIKFSNFITEEQIGMTQSTKSLEKRHRMSGSVRNEKDYSRNLENLKTFIYEIDHLKEIKINMKILKQNFKVEFEEIPSFEAIIQVSEKLIQRLLLAKLPLRNWYEEDELLFYWILIYYCCNKTFTFNLLKNEDWEIISEMLPGKTAEQCKFKYLNLYKLNLQEFPWSIEEDAILKDLVKEKKYIKWGEIAKDLYEKIGEIIYRPAKYCRERWNNYLDPDLKKGEWKLKEDIDLLNYVIKNGKKWSDISRNIKGRTENAVKNRFNSIIKQCQRKAEQTSGSESEFSSVSPENKNKSPLRGAEFQIALFILEQKNREYNDIKKNNSVIIEEKSFLENGEGEEEEEKDKKEEYEMSWKIKNTVLLSEINTKIGNLNLLKEIVSWDKEEETNKQKIENSKSVNSKKQIIKEEKTKTKSPKIIDRQCSTSKVLSESKTNPTNSANYYTNPQMSVFNFLSQVNQYPFAQGQGLMLDPNINSNINNPDPNIINQRIKEENLPSAISIKELPNISSQKSMNSFPHIPNINFHYDSNENLSSPNENFFKFLYNSSLNRPNLNLAHPFDEQSSFKNFSNFSSYTNFSFDNSSPFSQHWFNNYANNIFSFKVKFINDVNLNDEIAQNCVLQQAVVNLTKNELYINFNNVVQQTSPVNNGNINNNLPNSPKSNSPKMNKSTPMMNNSKHFELKLSKFTEKNLMDEPIEQFHKE